MEHDLQRRNEEHRRQVEQLRAEGQRCDDELLSLLSNSSTILLNTVWIGSAARTSQNGNA